MDAFLGRNHEKGFKVIKRTEKALLFTSALSNTSQAVG